MHVEWTSYSSPVGALTVVECEAGPLVVEFPHRAAHGQMGGAACARPFPSSTSRQGPCRATDGLAR